MHDASMSTKPVETGQTGVACTALCITRLIQASKTSKIALFQFVALPQQQLITKAIPKKI